MTELKVRVTRSPAKQAAEKTVYLEKVATGLLSGALKRSFPRINAGAPTRKGLRRYVIESLSRERLRLA